MGDDFSLELRVEPDGDGDAHDAAELLQQLFEELREAGADVEQVEGPAPAGAKGATVDTLNFLSSVGTEVVAACIVLAIERTRLHAKVWAKIRGKDGAEREVELAKLTKAQILRALEA